MWIQQPTIQTTPSPRTASKNTATQASTKLAFKNFLFPPTTTCIKTIQAKDPSEKSMEEYKLDFCQKLASLQIPAVLKYVPIKLQITEKAFTRMKTDSAYEEKMLALLNRDLDSYNGSLMSNAPASISIRIGETAEEYTATSASSFKAPDEKKETDSFWERRLKRHEMYKELEQKLNKKEKLLELIAKRAAARDAIQGGDGKEHPISVLVSAEELLLCLF